MMLNDWLMFLRYDLDPHQDIRVEVEVTEKVTVEVTEKCIDK